MWKKSPGFQVYILGHNKDTLHCSKTIGGYSCDIILWLDSTIGYRKRLKRSESYASHIVSHIAIMHFR